MIKIECMLRFHVTICMLENRQSIDIHYTQCDVAGCAICIQSYFETLNIKNNSIHSIWLYTNPKLSKEVNLWRLFSTAVKKPKKLLNSTQGPDNRLLQ